MRQLCGKPRVGGRGRGAVDFKSGGGQGASVSSPLRRCSLLHGCFLPGSEKKGWGAADPDLGSTWRAGCLELRVWGDAGLHSGSSEESRDAGDFLEGGEGAGQRQKKKGSRGPWGCESDIRSVFVRSSVSMWGPPLYPCILLLRPALDPYLQGPKLFQAVKRASWPEEGAGGPGAHGSRSFLCSRNELCPGGSDSRSRWWQAS